MMELERGELSKVILSGLTNLDRYKDYGVQKISPQVNSYNFEVVKLKPIFTKSTDISLNEPISNLYEKEIVELEPIVGKYGVEGKIGVSHLIKEILYQEL